MITAVNPEVTKVPPHEPVYHIHEAPVPRLPPEKLKVDEEPVHIAEGKPEAEPGGEEIKQTDIETLTQVVVLQLPSALT